MKLILRNIIILILSIGWLFPIGLGFAFIDEWIHLDVNPVIYGETQKQLNSFPSYQAGKELLIVGFIWLVAVVSIWGIYAVNKYSHRA